MEWMKGSSRREEPPPPPCSAEGSAERGRWWARGSGEEEDMAIGSP